MTEGKRPIAIAAASVPPRAITANAPRPFVGRMAGRGKHPLGDLFGLANFGVDLTRLAPGAVSALRHAHSLQDEFIYVLVGTPTLVTDAGQMPLEPGMCRLQERHRRCPPPGEPDGSVRFWRSATGRKEIASLIPTMISPR